MSIKEITFSEAAKLAAIPATDSPLMAGFRVARGTRADKADEGGDDWAGSYVKTWMEAIKPNIDMINKGIDLKLPVIDDISLPIGLSIITGGAGSGKTTWLRETLSPLIPDDAPAYFLKMGEPGYGIPYTYEILLHVIESKAAECVQMGKAGILMVDSLISLWFDPVVTSKFASGRGGASLGVPMLLQVIGQFALSQGFRVVAVLHPVFADPEVIGSGISGVSSFFLNKDTNMLIARDYQKVPSHIDAESFSSLVYERKARNTMSSESEMNMLARTIGEDD